MVWREDGGQMARLKDLFKKRFEGHTPLGILLAALIATVLFHGFPSGEKGGEHFWNPVGTWLRWYVAMTIIMGVIGLFMVAVSGSSLRQCGKFDPEIGSLRNEVLLGGCLIILPTPLWLICPWIFAPIMGVMLVLVASDFFDNASDVLGGS